MPLPLRAVSGEIRSLAGVLLDRWDAVEADFQRYYRLDLCSEFERAGCRRLAVLVENLPVESATWHRDGWSQQEELLAALIEVSDMWGRISAQLNNAKRSALPKPVEIPRPGEQRKQAHVVSGREFAALIEQREGGET